jgi:hypothetical protein
MVHDERENVLRLLLLLLVLLDAIEGTTKSGDIIRNKN